MLGSSGQGPITDGNGPGRTIALAVAVGLILGGGWYAWSGDDPATGLRELARPAATEVVAAPSPSPAAAAKLRGARPALRDTYVYDQGDVLSAGTSADLDTVLGALHTKAGPELVVMTVPTLGGAAVDIFARRVASQWGFGDKVRNDGVLLLVAPNERQVRIEVGTGLTTVLTNGESQQIIDTAMLPLFRDGQTERATVAGAQALVKVLAAHPTLYAPKAD